MLSGWTLADAWPDDDTFKLLLMLQLLQSLTSKLVVEAATSEDATAADDDEGRGCDHEDRQLDPHVERKHDQSDHQDDCTEQSYDLPVDARMTG